MDNYSIPDADDFGLSFSDDEFDDKIQAVFSEHEGDDIRSFAANVIIGNIPAKRLNENVGAKFGLSGCYIKDIQFTKNNKKGKYIIMFGRDDEGLCAYCSTSDKVFDALSAIISTYGRPSEWVKSVNVKIKANVIDENGRKAYSLEVLG